MSTPDEILDRAIEEAEADAPEDPAASSDGDAGPDDVERTVDATVDAATEVAAEEGASADDTTSPLDDGLTVLVADDGLTAELVLPPLAGTPPPDPQTIVDALHDEHGLVDVDEKAVDEAIGMAMEGTEKSVNVVVARGTVPRPGENGTIEWLGDFFESQAIQLPDGTVDHYHHTKISVKAGQPIATVHPPTTGTVGRTVKGKVIKPDPGSAATIDFDETVVRSDDDPNLLCAGRAGMVESYRGKITVSEVQIVEAVDFSTGSIDFEGAVQVRGIVEPKFSVVGVGTVIIGGPVENARVESRKTITVDKGVFGHGEGVVTCTGDISLGFARETQIHCGGRLMAKKELLWCEGDVHGDLLVEGGRVVGGHWRCGGRVVADELGSREEVTTIITLGEAPEQNRALRILTRDRKKYQVQLFDFKRKYGPLLIGKIGQLDAAQRAELQERMDLYRRQASRARKREYMLRKRLNIQRKASFLWVRTMIHGGTRVRMNNGKFVHEFSEAQPGPVCVRYDADAQTSVIEHIGLDDCTRRRNR